MHVPGRLTTKHLLTAALGLWLLLIVSCGGDSGDSDKASATQPTQTSSSSTTTTAPSTTLEPAGTDHVASEFEVPFSVTLPDGWTTKDVGLPTTVLEARPEGSDNALTIAIPIGDSPEAVVNGLEATSYEITQEEATTMGTFPATRLGLEFTAEGEPPTLFQLKATTTAPGAIPLGGPEIFLFAGSSGRLYVVDVDGTPVVVMIDAPQESFDRFAAEAESILETLTFESA